MPKMFRSAVIFVVLLCCSALLGSFVVWAQRPDPPPQPNQEFQPMTPPQAGQALGTQRIREGTAFRNSHVFFRQAGDRTVLYTVEGNQRFTCLENLALERILTAMRERPGRQFWRIEGEYTQFRGENFVLIRRAVIAQAPATGTPASISSMDP